MLPDLHVAPHWPRMQAPKPCETHQDAVRILNEIRQMIVVYRRGQVRDWRLEHAQTDYIVNVIAGLIADATVIDALHDRSHKDAARLEERVQKLEADLEGAKRPFAAQMEMQNRRITDLTFQLERLQVQALDQAREMNDESAAESVVGCPDRYRKIQADPAACLLLPCKLCGSPAELWQRWYETDIWHSFVTCTNLEDVDGEGCIFHFPPEPYYKERKIEAVDYWNLMMGPREGRS